MFFDNNHNIYIVSDVRLIFAAALTLAHQYNRPHMVDDSQEDEQQSSGFDSPQSNDRLILKLTSSRVASDVFDKVEAVDEMLEIRSSCAAAGDIRATTSSILHVDFSKE
jgi:hypothetical protein